MLDKIKIYVMILLSRERSFMDDKEKLELLIVAVKEFANYDNWHVETEYWSKGSYNSYLWTKNSNPCSHAEYYLDLIGEEY